MTQENSIKYFYREREIFLTGCTGFVGKFLIEKLLRSCSDLKKIYLLMRQKRGLSTDDRLKSLLEHPLFDKIRSENPKVFEKVEMIEGDCMEMNLGMSPEDCKKLKNVSVIFHSAASVKFEDILQKVILLHARGTRELCKFAETLTNLKSFVYVSTAYSNCTNDVTEEKVYPTKYNWQEYIKFAEVLNENTLTTLEKKLIGDFPNTYSFTKNLAENVCKYYSLRKNLPLSIYRPSIISASEAEPDPGWVDTLTGVMAIMFAFVAGLCRTFRSYEDSGWDMVPIDVCVKGIIVSAWKKWKDTDVEKKSNNLDVYNCAALKYLGVENLKKYGQIITGKHPFKYLLWKPNLYLAPNDLFATLNIYFTQLLPGICLDYALKLFNEKPRIVDALRKLYVGTEAGKVFVEHHTKFVNEKFKALDTELFDCDKSEFFLSEAIKSEFEYLEILNHGMLKHWFQQTEEETEKARFRYKIMAAIDFLCSKLFYVMVIYLLFKILCNIIYI